MSGCCGGEAILGGRPNGGVTPAPCCGFHAFIESGAPTANAGATTVVPIDFEIFDEGSFFNTVTFAWTPPIGLITITGTVDILDASAGDFIRAVIQKDPGTGVFADFKFGSQVPQSAASSDPRSVVTFVDKVTGTDRYRLAVFISSAANKTIEISSQETYFSGACLGSQCEVA